MFSSFAVPVFTLVRYFFNAPTLGSMPMALSLRTMRILALVTPAWLRPSKAIPLAMEASPITAICCLPGIPCNCADRAMPNNAEMAVELCPVPKASNLLSFIFGKPLMPPYCLLVSKIDFLPVSILCPYAWWPTSHINLSTGVLNT